MAGDTANALRRCNRGGGLCRMGRVDFPPGEPGAFCAWFPKSLSGHGYGLFSGARVVAGGVSDHAFGGAGSLGDRPDDKLDFLQPTHGRGSAWRRLGRRLARPCADRTGRPVTHNEPRGLRPGLVVRVPATPRPGHDDHLAAPACPATPKRELRKPRAVRLGAGSAVLVRMASQRE
jgi:hypothetical protein